ncbi:MAG: hypothetical protein OHK0056_32500 [Bacteriovoracaceae bacterium]
MQQIEQIKAVLADRLTSFRDQNPEKHSYAYISMRTEVNPKFVERAMKNQLGSDIDSKKVLDLAKLVCDPKETQDIAEFFAGRLLGESSILKDAIFAKLIRENGLVDVSEEVEEILKTENGYVVYCLCVKSVGSSEEDIISILGKSGLDTAFNLVNKGILRREGDKFFARVNSFTYSFDYLPRVFQTLARFYKPSNVGKLRNYAHVLTCGLSRDGIKEWQAEHKRHHEALRNIRDNNRGNIDTFSVGYMDTFTSEDIDSANYINSKKEKKMKNGISKILMSLLFLIFCFTFAHDSMAQSLNSKVEQILKSELGREALSNNLPSEITLELSASSKIKLKNDLVLMDKPSKKIIKFSDIDLIRAIEVDGRFDLDSGLLNDGREFNFRDISIIRRMPVGGDGDGDAGGG